MAINTVLFDLDGTLLNTTKLVKESFIYAFKNFYPDYILTEDELNAFIGPTLTMSFSKYTSDEDEINTLIKLYREHNLSHHDELVSKYPYVEEVVSGLFNKGYKLAIVTSKKADIAKMGLRIANIEKYFDVIIGYNEVIEHKPHPESVLKALEMLGSKAIETIMVGDNDSDIYAGKKANVLTVGVLWAHNLDRLKKAEPDIVINDMLEIFNLLEEE